MPLRFLKVFLISISLSSIAAQSYADKRGSDWYDRKAEGWFFYKDPKEIEPPKEKEEPAPVQEQVEEQEETTEPPEIVTGTLGKKSKPSESKDEGPKQGSSAWIKENLPKIINIAIDNPTEKNVKRAAYLHKEMERKADKFSEMWVSVHSMDPVLDANNQRPSTSTMKDLMGRRMIENRGRVLKNIGKDAGFIFFFDPEHPFTNPMAINVDSVARLNNLDVLGVSKTGKGLTLPYFEDFETDIGQMEQLGIRQVPALYMYVVKEKKWVPIAESYLNVMDMEARIISHSHQVGLISEEDFRSTRDVVAPDRYYEDKKSTKQVTEKNNEKVDPYRNYFETLIGAGA